MKIDGKELTEGRSIIFPLEGYSDENQVNGIYEVTAQIKYRIVVSYYDPPTGEYYTDMYLDNLPDPGGEEFVQRCQTPLVSLLTKELKEKNIYAEKLLVTVAELQPQIGLYGVIQQKRITNEGV